MSVFVDNNDYVSLHIALYFQQIIINICCSQFFFLIVTEKWKETCPKEQKPLQEETGEMIKHICYYSFMHSADVL